MERVGRFAEVEIVADEGRRAEAQALLQRVAAELGLDTVERRSYLHMTLELAGT